MVTISPTIPFTISPSQRTLLIQPSTNLAPSTKYIVTVQVAEQSFFVAFTTVGPTPTLGQSTRPIDQVDEDNEALKAQHPDVFLSNYTPYSNSSFSITSAYVSGSPGHFQFTVTPKMAGQSVTASFQSWAQQQGLNSSQTSSLDVVYK